MLNIFSSLCGGKYKYRTSSTCFELVAEGTLGPPGIFPILSAWIHIEGWREGVQSIFSSTILSTKWRFHCCSRRFEFPFARHNGRERPKDKKFPLCAASKSGAVCGAASFLFWGEWCTRRGLRPPAGCAASGFTSHKNAPATYSYRANCAGFILQASAENAAVYAKDSGPTTMGTSLNNAENGWTARRGMRAVLLILALSAGGNTRGMDVKFVENSRCGENITMN